MSAADAAEGEAIRAVEELLLETRIEAELATDSSTSTLEVTPQVIDGQWKLIGPWLEQSQRELVLEIARRFTNEREVEFVTGYEPVMEL